MSGVMFYVWCCLINLACTFNFFPKDAFVFTNENSESFFGYSVLLQSASNESRLIVGAPRANSTSPLHKNLIEPGAVYSCALSNKECTQYLLYLNENTEEKSRIRESYTHKKDNGWLGCSIDGTDELNGPVVACAPRWVNQVLFPTYYFAQGICYYLQDSRQIEKKSITLLPLLDKGKQGYIRVNETVYYYAYGQAGTSVYLSQNNLTILIGAPGILQWQGMVLKYYLDNLEIHYNKENIPNPNNIIQINDFSYFGYTVSSGKFMKSSNRTWYVAGAPRGSNLKGQVLLYEYDQSGTDLRIHDEMSGRQHGEYFGAALSVGDINRDGVDDIIIGGPLFSTPLKHDVGCAYVYLNNGQGEFIKHIVQGGNVAGSRFGTAISLIGDINGDGYTDAVISAPYYDNNKGAIFIYHGSKTGLNENYSQMIIATEIKHDLRGFGISISRGIDVDNNMYNDIAVGSFLSGHAVIIRTRPVVRIKGTLITPTNQISVHTKSVSFSACINYTGLYLPENLNIKTIITIDPFYNRAIISKPNNNYGNKWEIVKSYKYNRLLCEELSLSVLDSHLDVTQPITILMEYALVETERRNDYFCSTCPVENKSLSNRSSLLIHYETGCGSDDICQPDLAIKAYFDFDKPYIVTGRDEIIRLNMEIINTGEPAYVPKLYAEIPLSTSFDEIPNVCQTLQNNLLLCDLGKPLYQNKTTKITIPIDISVIKIKSDEAFFAVLNVTSLGLDINLNDNVVIIRKEVKTETQISVIGISEPEQFSLGEINDMKLKLQLTHTYIVQNLGPSVLHNLEMTFLFPQRFNEYEENIFEVYKLEATNIRCYSNYFNSTLYENNNLNTDNLYIHTKTKRMSKESEPIISPQSALFFKMQKITGSDDALPPNVPLNRMMSLNCANNSMVSCLKIECYNEVKLKRFEQVAVTFGISTNLKLLDKVRGDKDVIVVSSSLLPKFKSIGNWTYAHTLLQATPKYNYPTKWIVVACVLGIIIFNIIVFILYKAGFFRRHKHEKLMNEKGVNS